MNANELRIGNLIYKPIPKKDMPIEIVEILSINDSFDYLDVKNKDGYITESCELNKFIPIPLTEEILLKCGFEYQDDLGIFFKGLFEIQKLRLGIDLRERFEAMLYDFNPSLDYLHQLQNLYFALTGEELNVNL